MSEVTQSCLTLCVPGTIQSMEFSRPEYWSGEPFPSPRVLPNPGIEPESFMSLALVGGIFTTSAQYFGYIKSLQMVIAAMKLKDAYSLEEKLSPT